MAEARTCPNGHPLESCGQQSTRGGLPLNTCPQCGAAADSGKTPPLPEGGLGPMGRQDVPPPSVPGYEILGELGAGGMGVVYKARHLALNRLVALKMVLPGAGSSADLLERFRAEAQAVARLRHPNVVQIYDVAEHDGRAYLALEYVEGGSLEGRLKGQPQPPRQAAELLRVLAGAVQAAHEAGIVHRDLKPANVLVTADGTPKVTDFGLAKELHADRQRTQTGQVVGTPGYMAPEQARGQSRQIGPPADVFALGVLLYELLTGRRPFHGKDWMETLQQVCQVDPVPPSRLEAKVPRDLETVCLKCLEKEPARRYPSAKELAEDLERFLNHESVSARRAGLWERAVRRARRRPAAVLAALLGLLGAALAGTLLLTLSGWWHEPRSAAMRRACPPVPWGPPADVEVIRGKPQRRDLNGFEVLEESLYWDLTQWRPVPPDQRTTEPVEPAFLTTVLRLRKRLGAENNGVLVQHFRTSGYGVWPRCPGLPSRLRQYREGDSMPQDSRGKKQQAMRVWELRIDVSDVGQEGKPFEIVIHSVWWNAFQDQEQGKTSDWLAHRRDAPAGAVDIALRLPRSRRLVEWGFSDFAANTNRPFPSSQAPGTYVHTGRGLIYWHVPEPQTNCVYRIDWRWKPR
jgi:hypothetical protein